MQTSKNNLIAFFCCSQLLIPTVGAEVKVERLAKYDQFDMPTFLRGPYVLAFWNRHNLPFRRQSAIHALMEQLMTKS
jgi:hypothetical protein